MFCVRKNVTQKFYINVTWSNICISRTKCEHVTLFKLSSRRHSFLQRTSLVIKLRQHSQMLWKSSKIDIAITFLILTNNPIVIIDLNFRSIFPFRKNSFWLEKFENIRLIFESDILIYLLVTNWIIQMRRGFQ